MMLNPRHDRRVNAEIKLQDTLTDIIEKYDLSFGEIFVIISKIMTNWAHHLQKAEDEAGNVHNKR